MRKIVCLAALLLMFIMRAYGSASAVEPLSTPNPKPAYTPNPTTQIEHKTQAALFRDIPWFTDIDSVSKQLRGDVGGRQVLRARETLWFFDYWGNTGTTWFDDACYELKIYLKEKSLSVAGHAVEDICLYALHCANEGKISYMPEDSKFFQAEYSFYVTSFNVDDVYNDLLRKITDLYGEALAMTENTSVWSCADHTGIHLQKGSTPITSYVNLCYVKYDIVDSYREFEKAKSFEYTTDENSSDGL